MNLNDVQNTGISKEPLFQMKYIFLRSIGGCFLRIKSIWIIT